MPHTFPGKGQETVPGGVAVPGRVNFQELPAAVPDLRALQAGQQFAIKFFQDWINRLLRRRPRCIETFTRRPSS